MQATRGEKRQVDRNVVAAVNRLKGPSHARLIRNHEGILRVRPPIAPVGSGGVMDGAAGGVEDLLLVVGQQRAHQGSPAGVEVDRPRHRLTAAQLQYLADQFEHCTTQWCSVLPASIPTHSWGTAAFEVVPVSVVGRPRRRVLSPRAATL